jgi:hypothetical protein
MEYVILKVVVDQVDLIEKHFVQDGFIKFKEKFWSKVARVKNFTTLGGDNNCKYEGDHQHTLVKPEL